MGRFDLSDEEIARCREVVTATTPDGRTDIVDVVNHPPHYRLANGAEVIDLTENLNFCRGNAVKYIARAGLKNSATEVEDLKKARWYIDRELARLERGAS